jgi:hypothetical protein
MNKEISYIKTDKNVILNEACIRWVKKIDECLEVCAKSNGCYYSTYIDTHRICKDISYDSYIKLNKHFDKVKNSNN